jgi:hypothetical protein
MYGFWRHRRDRKLREEQEDKIQWKAHDDTQTLYDPHEGTSLSKAEEGIYIDPYAETTRSDNGDAFNSQRHDTMSSTYTASLYPLGVGPEDQLPRVSSPQQDLVSSEAHSPYKGNNHNEKAFSLMVGDESPAPTKGVRKERFGIHRLLERVL